MIIKDIQIKKLSWLNHEEAEIELVLKMLEGMKQEMTSNNCLKSDDGLITFEEINSAADTLQKLVKARCIVEVRDIWELGQVK